MINNLPILSRRNRKECGMAGQGFRDRYMPGLAAHAAAQYGHMHACSLQLLLHKAQYSALAVSINVMAAT